MARALIHLNGNLMCAVDTETTGLIAGYHDIIQVCVLPLDSDFEPLRELNGEPLLPFYMNLKPKRPEHADDAAMKVHKITMAELIQNGTEPYKAADLFDEWVARLKLPFRKQICPLGANYPFDKGFLIDWLGEQAVQQFFDYHYRDIQPVAQFLNDRSAFHAGNVPFPKVNVAYLASQLGIEHSHAHDALQDCLIEARIYKEMLKRFQL